MHSNHSRRGRPKGSGIDDSRLLREIATKIIDDPELKPTTAIKNAGISDPSTIRRLRDKFNRQKETLFRELSSQLEIEKRYTNYNSNAAPNQGQTIEIRTMALNHRREPSQSEPVPANENCRKRKSSGSKSDEESRRSNSADFVPQEAICHLMAGHIRTSSAIWQMQLAMTSQTFQSPVVRSALRYQLAFYQSLFRFKGNSPAIP